jgi:hypothetical protein
LHFEVENVPTVVADVVMVNANNNHDDHVEDNDGEGNECSIGRGPEETHGQVNVAQRRVAKLMRVMEA